MPRLPVIPLVAATACLLTAADWPQFRGPNAFGVSDTTGLPTEFGPAKNVVWRTALPPGHSSPVLSANRIFLTAFSEDQLYVITLERSTGKILWRRELLRMLWRVAYADGRLDKYEEALLRKLGDLLFLSHDDFIREKLAVIDDQGSRRTCNRPWPPSARRESLILLTGGCALLSQQRLDPPASATQ